MSKYAHDLFQNHSMSSGSALTCTMTWQSFVAADRHVSSTHVERMEVGDVVKFDSDLQSTRFYIFIYKSLTDN